MGRSHPGRRVLRGLAELRPLPRCGERRARLSVRRARPSGAGRRERLLRGRHRPRRDRPVERPLRHDAGAHRSPGGHRSRPPGCGGARPRPRRSLQGGHGHRAPRRSPRRRGRRARLDRHADAHEQRGRRPARLDGQHPRGRTARTRTLEEARARHRALRRERVVHPRARGGIRAMPRSPTSCTRCSARRTAFS